jgi:uncharacterized membrane protein
MEPLSTYVQLGLIVVVVDAVWLGLTGQNFLRMINKIQGSPATVRMFPAFLVYVALAYLVSLPKSYKEAFLLGLATYSVYDFTNLALLKDYDPKVAVADAVWGGVLFTIVFAIRKRFL